MRKFNLNPQFQFILSLLFCGCSSRQQHFYEKFYQFHNRQFILATVYHFNQSVSFNKSFTKPLTQLDINIWLWASLRVKLINVLLWFKIFASHIFPVWTFRKPVGACGMASILHLFTRSHFSYTLVDTEHLIHSWFPDVSDVPLSSGAEGSQGALFCREGREEQS